MGLAQRFFTVSGLTVISRVFGVIREAMLSHFLGACAEMDAFLIAFKFPCFFRKFFAEGGFQSIFVPYFTDFIAVNKIKGARYFSSRIFTITFWVMLFFSIIVFIFAKEFVLLMAPGFTSDPEKMSLSIEFTRIIFPSVAFVSLSTIYSGILVAHKRFFAFSVVPILVNFVLMASLFVCEDMLTAGRRISYGVLAAGVFQFIYLYICVRVSGLTRPTMSSVKITPKIKVFLKKLLPVLAGAGVAQVNVFMGSLFGSFLPTGCITYIYFADRFIQFPLALFGISMGIVLLPEIAMSISKGKSEDIKQVQNKAILFTMRMTLPSVIGLIALSYYMIAALYGHGKFSEISVQKTADVLKVFSIGLPAYVAAKIISSVLFAQKDSKTPVMGAIVSIIANIVLSGIFLIPLQEVGIALATSISGFINVYVMCRKSKGWFLIDKKLIFDFCKIFIASIIMLLTIIFFEKIISVNEQKLSQQVLFVTGCCFMGCIVYIISLFFLKDSSVRLVAESIKNKYFKKS